MTREKFVLLSLLALATACTQSQSQQMSGPIAVCAKGWMYDTLTPDGTCANACQAKTPECAASDCVQKPFTAYLANGALVNVVVSYSASMGTMSTITQASKTSYAITSDTTYVVTPPGGAQGTVTASCKNGQLLPTKSGDSITSGAWIAAPTGFSQALDTQVNAGRASWTGVPVSK